MPMSSKKNLFKDKEQNHKHLLELLMTTVSDIQQYLSSLAVISLRTRDSLEGFWSQEGGVITPQSGGSLRACVEPRHSHSPAEPSGRSPVGSAEHRRLLSANTSAPHSFPGPMHLCDGPHRWSRKINASVEFWRSVVNGMP